MKAICFRCKHPIDEKEQHYSFREFINGKVSKEDFTHKKCWDDFLSKVSTLSEAQGMLKALKKPLIRMGLLESEEVVKI